MNDQHTQRAGEAALHPLRNRVLSMIGQEIPPLNSETPMPAVKVLPKEEFEEVLAVLCPLTGRLRASYKQGTE